VSDPSPAASAGPPRRRVALVIGSGSVKCSAALGLKMVLEREGIEVSRLVGCSGGSIYAACLAVGYSAAQTADLARRFWTRDVTAQKDRRQQLALMFPRLFGFSVDFGLTKDTLTMDRLRSAFGERTFADAKIPLHIAATDFETGDQVILESGSIVDALRASIAIPFVFKPWIVEGRRLVDGCLSDPLPVNVAIREGEDLILAVGFESPMQTEMPSATRFAFQISSVITNNLLKAKFAFHNLAHHAEVIAIIPQFDRRIRLFDTDQIPYIIEAGKQAAEEQLPHLKRLLAAPVSTSGM